MTHPHTLGYGHRGGGRPRDERWWSVAAAPVAVVIAGLVLIACAVVWGEAPKPVTKDCAIKPAVFFDAKSAKPIHKYQVSGTAKDAGDDEVRRYTLGEYTEHDRAIDACMDWVRCSTSK